MKVSDFDYYLPEELIAQDPLENRSASRLMVLDKNTGEVTHRHFYDIKDYLEPGDCLVINDTRVIPARLLGFKEDTGAHVEVLLLKRLEADRWECLVRPGKKLREGARVVFGDGILRGRVLCTRDDGNRIVEFEYEGIFEEVLDRLGEMPLPPYITHKLKDRNRYQTVYAVHDGSAAAPTAGLHFTRELLKEIEDMGVHIARITLHVGLGTFRPVKAETIEDHHMHSEYYIVSEEAAKTVNEALINGRRVVAVGTTSTRTLESAAVLNPEYTRVLAGCGTSDRCGTPDRRGVSGSHGGIACCEREELSDAVGSMEPEVSGGAVESTANGLRILRCPDGSLVPRYLLAAGSGDTSIFIYPGYEWKLVGSLITNFHLPKSTLIMLVSALAGRDHVLAAYEEAVRERYRFFSFGDAMLLTQKK